MPEMLGKFVYSAIRKLNSLYRSCRSTVARYFGNRALIMQERQLRDEFGECVHKKNDIVKDSNRDAVEDIKCHSNLGLSDLWWCGISERLPAVNSATLYKLLYRHAVDRQTLP